MPLPSQASRPSSDIGWPAVGLDVQALASEGWTPRPFRQFILKLIGRCNLACEYCYVYEMADTSWRAKPRFIATRTLDRVATRIADHVAAHDLADVEVVLHGGEPLLRGAGFIDEAVSRLRGALPARVGLTIRLQTNGTLLTAEALDTLVERDIKIGVSFDGTARSHDARRVHRDGRGSHQEVATALQLLGTGPYARAFSGILCTIDLSADPVRTYEALAAFAPPRVDFLLPHANWEVQPQAGYGQWLAAAFDRWYDGAETRVRLFEEIIKLLLGGQSTNEMIGLSPVALVVIDTDGSLEQVDTLKSAFPGAPATGMNVFTHAFDDLLSLPSTVARQIGVLALAEDCLACPVHRICGGGYYPHRYRPGTGFKNPSVYCADLRYLISHIGRRVRADLSCLPGTGCRSGTWTRSPRASVRRPPSQRCARPSTAAA